MEKNKKIWFKRKTYGYGWVPATWQGWTILGVWTIFFVAGCIVFSNKIEANPNEITVGIFVAYVAILVFILISLSYKHGETPRWQWGEKEKDESKK